MVAYASTTIKDTTRARANMAIRAKIVKHVSLRFEVKQRISFFKNVNFMYPLKALPCDLKTNTCQNDGACSNDNMGGYVCDCQNGYTGKDCETSWRNLNFFKWFCCVACEPFSTDPVRFQSKTKIIQLKISGFKPNPVELLWLKFLTRLQVHNTIIYKISNIRIMSSFFFSFTLRY